MITTLVSYSHNMLFVSILIILLVSFVKLFCYLLLLHHSTIPWWENFTFSVNLSITRSWKCVTVTTKFAFWLDLLVGQFMNSIVLNVPKKLVTNQTFFWCFITAATFVSRLKGYLMMVFEAKVSITIWSLEGNVPSSKMTKSYFSIKLLCFHQPPIDITCVRRLWLYDKSVRKMVIGTF